MSQENQFLALNGEMEVVGLLNHMAGPLTACILAAFGAKVSSVEFLKTRGDMGRSMPPRMPGYRSWIQAAHYPIPIPSICFRDWEDESRQVIFDMLRPSPNPKVAKVLLMNQFTGSYAKWGLTPEALREINPGLIYATISPFGRRVHRKGVAIDSGAIGGLQFSTGESGDPPIKPPPFEDAMAAIMTAFEIAMAQRKFQATGEGTVIDGTLLGQDVLAMSYFYMFALNHVTSIRRWEHQAHQIIPTCGLFKSKTAWFWCNALSEPQAMALIRHLRIEDERFQTFEGMQYHRDDLMPILADRFGRKPAQRWVEELDGLGIPASIPNNVYQAVGDPLVQPFIAKCGDDDFGPIRRPALPFGTEGMEIQYGLPRRLGEDGMLILEELYGAERAKDLFERGVVVVPDGDSE